MSRSGRIPINIPDNTEVRLEKGSITAKGKLGELSYNFGSSAKVEVNTKNIVVTISGNNKHYEKMWGTVRSRIFRARQLILEFMNQENILNG